MSEEYVKPKYDKWCLKGQHIPCHCTGLMLVPDKEFPQCYCIACQEWYDATPEFLKKVDSGW